MNCYVDDTFVRVLTMTTEEQSTERSVPELVRPGEMASELEDGEIETTRILEQQEQEAEKWSSALQFLPRTFFSEFVVQ